MSKLKYYNGTNWIDVGGNITGDTLPIGSIMPYGSATAPTNWLVCDGSAVSRTTYAELFSAIGTSFGAGDGSTTFNLPNLKGKVAVGQDTTQTEFDTIGETGGSKTQTITLSNLPNEVRYPKYSSSETWALQEQSNGHYPLQDGSNTPINLLQPYQVVCYIIKAKQSAGVVGNVSNTYSTSQTDTYSCNYINGIIESGSNANGYYTKYADGTLICRYFVGPITINSNSGATQAVTFPISFIDTNWQCMIQLTNGQNYWSWIATAVKSKTASGFTLDIWNNSEGQCPGQYFDYIAIGRWK